MRKAREVCEKLRSFPSEPVGPTGGGCSKLAELAETFQNVEDKKVARYLYDNGLQALLRIFDGHINDSRSDKSDILFVLKVFALYGYEDGIRRIPEVARNPNYSDGYLWCVVFEVLLQRHKELALTVVEALRDKFPSGFAAIAYLDLCNHCCREEILKMHPFDNGPGRDLLEGWLKESDGDDCAISATASLPFLQPTGRDALLSLAFNHISPAVRMEAAWASAKLGNTAGMQMLQEMCNDPNHSLRSQRYLNELGLHEMIPAKSQEPDFMAMAEMCSWLSHPMEFGRSPSQIELYDTRELFWPPTNDRRRVWLFKYNYDEPEEKDSGLGMVGSVTFALFGEATANLPAEDAYGLYCLSELKFNDDPRTPSIRTPDAGRKFLAKYNNGF